MNKPHQCRKAYMDNPLLSQQQAASLVLRLSYLMKLALITQHAK